MQNIISIIDNNKILKNIFNEKYFRIVFLLSVVLRVNPFIAQYIGPITKLFLVWGMILISYDLMTNKNILHKKFSKIIYVFLLFYGVVILVNYKDNLVANIISYAYIYIKMTILYVYNPDRDKNDMIKEIGQCNNAFIVVTFIGAIISLIMVLLNTNFRYLVGDYLYEAGIYRGRLWGFFQNPNAGGSLASISIMLTVCNMLIQQFKQNKSMKIYYSINIFIQLIYLFLTGSRGAKVSFISFIIVSVILFSVKLLAIREKKYAIRSIILTCIIIPMIFIFSGYVSKNIIPKISNQKPNISYYLWSLDRIEPPTGYVPPVADKSDNEDKVVVIDRENNGEDVVGGRKALWHVGLQIIKKYPIFGVGDENVSDYAIKMKPDNMILHGIEGGGMHNFIIQTAVASGLVGVSIIITLMVSFTITVFKYIIYMVKYKKFNDISIIIISLLISLVVNGMVESGLIFNTVFSSIILWIYMGYLMYFIETEIKKI